MTQQNTNFNIIKLVKGDAAECSQPVKITFLLQESGKKNARELWPSGVLIQWMVQHGAGNLIITNKGRNMLPCSNFWKTSCFVTNSKRNQKQHFFLMDQSNYTNESGAAGREAVGTCALGNPGSLAVLLCKKKIRISFRHPTRNKGWRVSTWAASTCCVLGKPETVGCWPQKVQQCTIPVRSATQTWAAAETNRLICFLWAAINRKSFVSPQVGTDALFREEWRWNVPSKKCCGAKYHQQFSWKAIQPSIMEMQRTASEANA